MRIPLFHRHHWRERERFYMPPRELQPGLTITYTGPVGSLERRMAGVTTIVYTCIECGCPKTVEVLGRQFGPSV